MKDFLSYRIVDVVIYHTITMMRLYKNTTQKSGFTLVELLVVIAIIGLLSTFAVVALVRAREKAREARASGDIAQIRTAITMLVNDTGKWPNGCRPDSVSNPEVNINASAAGINVQPTVGDQGDGCFWTSSDIASWNGPYVVKALVDPWGNDYYFDPDYTPYANCNSKTTKGEVPGVISFGKNGVGLNGYDCDDVWVAL